MDLIITSPPYAEQRKNQYGGTPASEYPKWTVRWMDAAREKLKDSGSICINFKANLKKGEIQAWELETVMAIRMSGWIHCGTFPWVKPNSPPLGSTLRPREAWEPIYWFAKSGSPKCFPKAGGRESNRIGFENNKFEHGGKSHISKGQNSAKSGIARVPNYIEAGTGEVEKGYKHPAMFPPEVPEYFITLLTEAGDLVCDPFDGSGTTGRACDRLNRNYIGFDKSEEYINMWNSMQA
ncbi:DNA methylase [Popillia japonica]|uniref:site-specific DNA-methyltransferase (cytosine-N(4)-specific) n=1 Tax=Popillia japonica TaxID=7064 RepID=A0AAW1HVA0_POPJA